MSRSRYISINLGTHECLGDALASLSAGLNIIHQKNLSLSFNSFIYGHLAHMYNDRRIRIKKTRAWTSGDVGLTDRAHIFHQGKNNYYKKNNFVGAYIAGLGFKFKGFPPIICPGVGKPGLEPRSYCVLQPYAKTLSRFDIKKEALEKIITTINEKYNIPVIIGGNHETPRGIRGARYMLGDIATFFSLIANARFVLGPESAIAHIASGYRVPAIIWRTDRRAEYMWIFNYPKWNKLIVPNRKKDIIRILNQLPEDFGRLIVRVVRNKPGELE